MLSGGTITLTIRVVSLTSGLKQGNWHVPTGTFVVITVEDNGHGMSQRIQDRLLEPFFTTKHAGLGTGLGFPMAHRFVTQSGGHLVVKSEVDQGTSVALYFPLAAAGEQSSGDDFNTSQDRAGNETVLIVENDPAVRDVLTALLTRLGYRVLTASSPSEARDVLAGNDQVDILLTDMVLGCEQNGIELANEIRRDLPALPVLLISGVADVSIACSFSDPDRVRWLDKPFSRKDVSQKLRELLDD